MSSDTAIAIPPPLDYHLFRKGLDAAHRIDSGSALSEPELMFVQVGTLRRQVLGDEVGGDDSLQILSGLVDQAYRVVRGRELRGALVLL